MRLACAALLHRPPREPDAIDGRRLQRSQRAEPGAELEALLNTFPAAAELYENQQYAQAGLCRQPLELSLNTEQQARKEIERIARP